MQKLYFTSVWIAVVVGQLAWMTCGFCSETAQDSDYLAAFFIEKKDSTGRESSQLYYAIASTGFRFEYSVKQGQPILASTVGDKLIRDPMILRDPNGHGFHLVATVSWKGRSFVMFDSTDLIHWTNERLVTVAPDDADMVWAPELRWDPASKQYFVYWTTSQNGKWSTAGIWYSTSTDLKSFSPPKMLMKEGRDGCLDADIICSNGKWYMVYRYTGLWMRTSSSAFGPYLNPVKISDLNVEGPFLFPINGSTQWGLIFDYFGGNQGKWGLQTSPDFIHWTPVTGEKWPYYNDQVFFPPGIRHGCVISITKSEADSVLKAFGASEVLQKP